MVGLSIVRKVFENSFLVGLLTKTDPGRIAQLIQGVERAGKTILGVRMVDGTYVEQTVDFMVRY